jgi:hypothetical protein
MPCKKQLKLIALLNNRATHRVACVAPSPAPPKALLSADMHERDVRHKKMEALFKSLPTRVIDESRVKSVFMALLPLLAGERPLTFVISVGGLAALLLSIAKHQHIPEICAKGV